MKRFYLALTLAFLPAKNIFSADDPIRSFEKRVTEYTLKNGFKLLILERHNAPLVSFEMMFRTGGINETSGKTGLAHLFEHMMFKGSQTVGTRDYSKEKPLMEQEDRLARQKMEEELKGKDADKDKIAALKVELAKVEAEQQKWVIPSEFDQIYQREGGEGLNAFTSKDMTGFVVSLPSNKWSLWPILESDRMAHPVLREFYKERDVVMEERRMRYENDPDGKLWENFLSLSFQASPYGQPTIGWMSDIEFLSRQDAESFFKVHYAPNRAVVAIVGDVQAKEVIAACERYFAQVSSQAHPLEHVTQEPPQAGEKRAFVRYDAEPQLLMGFHKPSSPDPDNYTMEVIEDILSRGRTSRFYQNIVEDKVALSVYASNGNPGEKYDNLIIFGGAPRKPFTNKDLEEKILSELEKLKNEKVSERELEKIRNQMEADFIRNLSSNSGMAGQLAYYDAVLGGWRNLLNYLDGIRRVTPGDIQKAAQKYFTSNNRSVAYLERESSKP